MPSTSLKRGVNESASNFNLTHYQLIAFSRQHSAISLNRKRMTAALPCLSHFFPKITWRMFIDDAGRKYRCTGSGLSGGFS